MQKKMVLSVLAALAYVGFSASAAITLTGTALDVKMGNTVEGHPDFETPPVQNDLGIVGSQLGGDGTPIYAGNPTTPTTSGAANFYSWYHSVPEVNSMIPLTLTLNESSPGIYTYDNPSFFPLDGLGFGNQSYAHNYAFTFQLHSSFTYVQGQFFNFRGDDDVFVYINNQLVINLGGIHPAQTAGVNLDTLGLIAGQDYTLDLFFAERHTVDSSFRMDTSIELVPVPEPTTLLGGALLALPLGFQIVRRTFRRRQLP